MGNCVFCDHSKVRERLITENRDWYVVATLGQITDGGYVLVIPKKHIPCMGVLSSHFVDSQTDSMLKLTFKVNRAVVLEYQKSSSTSPWPITLFEHGIIGQTIKHAHLHVLPAVTDLTSRILADFPGTEIDEVQYASHLQVLYKKRREPYLFWTKPQGGAMVCWNPPAPPQYLRLIVAELLGRPERGNWRNMDPKLDKRLCDETVTRLRPYFS